MGSKHAQSMEELGRQEVRVHFLDTRSSTTMLFAGPNTFESDQALARALQEQEKAYASLGINQRFIDHDSAASSSSVYMHHGTYSDGYRNSDNSRDSSTRRMHENDRQIQEDEAFARALQDTVNREDLAQLMSLTGISESNGVRRAERRNTEDIVDPDNLSYEDLIALEEAMGSHNNGLSPEEIKSLSVTKYKPKKKNTHELCMVCLDEYVKGEALIQLPCKHSYHADCIRKWLEIRKICPVCGLQVQIKVKKRK